MEVKEHMIKVFNEINTYKAFQWKLGGTGLKNVSRDILSQVSLLEELPLSGNLQVVKSC